MSEPIGVQVYGADGGKAGTIGRRVFARGDDRSTFVALIAPAFASELPQDVCDEVLAAMDEAVSSGDTETVRQLDAAVQAANALLFERNLRTDANHQVVAGIAAVAWEGEQASVAVLGPVSAIGFANGKLFHVRALDDEGSAGGLLDATRVAGLEPHVSPQLFRVPFDSECGLLIAPDSVEPASRDLLSCVVGRPAAEGDAQWTEMVNGTGSVGVLISPFLPQDLSLPASTAPSLRVEPLDMVPNDPVETQTESDDDTVALAGTELEKSDIAPDSSEVTELELAVSMEQEPSGSEEADSVPVAELAASAESSMVIQTEESSADPSLEEVDDEFAFPWEQSDRDDGTISDDDVDEEDQEFWSAESNVPVQGAQDSDQASAVSEAWYRARVRFGQGIRRVEEWAVGVLPEELPQRPEVVSKKESVALSGRALVFIAMAIPIVMLVFVLITRVQYDRAIEAQFDAVQLAAQDAYQLADSSADQAVQRQYLEEALLQADQGLAMRPDDAMLTTLKTRVEHDLDEINAVERIYTFYKLAEIDEYSASVSDSARILLQDQDLFLLHRGSDCVYRYEMNQVGDALEPVGTDPLLVQQGQVYDGIAASELVDMAWIGEGGLRGTSAFTVLDRAGTLYVFDEQLGVTALPVANSQTWRQPKAMAGYFGNLYVLDTLLGSLLKYEPIDDAYTRAPSSYIDTSLGADLTGAVDLAVDGNMYVLFADGHIDKYYDGIQVPFNSMSVPQPMMNPTAIFVSGEQEPEAEGYVYVADAGNARIVQFDKDGNYVRQLQSKIAGIELDDLRGLYVDEISQRIIVLSGRSLWLGTLPPM